MPGCIQRILQCAKRAACNCPRAGVAVEAGNTDTLQRSRVYIPVNKASQAGVVQKCRIQLNKLPGTTMVPSFFFHILTLYSPQSDTLRTDLYRFVKNIPCAPVQNACDDQNGRSRQQRRAHGFSAAHAVLRFDICRARQAVIVLDPQNQPGGPNPAEPVKKQKKGGKKTLLFVILGIAAAFLVAGVVILLLSLKNCSGGKASGSYLLITTQDGGRYLNDEKGVLFEEADDFYAFSSDLKAQLIKRNGRWYHVENGKQIRFGDSDSRVVHYDWQNLSWVLYEDKNGDFNIFRKEGGQTIPVKENSAYYQSMSSANGRYLAMGFTYQTRTVLLRFSASSGELSTTYLPSGR